ncbi:hypothetical protein ABEB36_001145 [Hypothenemus hampei]|uniref:Flightin n=1 Tax=Hypothenemus hampei TaxID=57062 RepID=A0ABD1FDQ1_HYPHA
MDDDNSDWFSAADEPEAEPAAATATAAASDSVQEADDAPASGDAPPQETGAAEPTEAADEYLDPDKLLLFKHWIRPKYLQYKCIYDYRKSYYDDVLEAIEYRRKGYRRNIPRPQTWAERVLRSQSHPVYRSQSFDRFLEDIKLVTRTAISRKIYASQSLSNFNSRYTTRL